MVPSLFAASFLAFVLIQLPPGDYVTTYIATLAASNEVVDQNTAAELRERFGLDQPISSSTGSGSSGIVLRGDFGLSFEWQQPVSGLIWERMALTLMLTVATLLATWAIALPIGVYSAVRKYSIGDYFFTFLGFLGLAIPNFLLALVLMYVAAVEFGQNVGGLFSEQYENAPWSIGQDRSTCSQHLWIPVIVLAMSGTASLIRIMRANMLDELNKPYVTTARAKGLSEFRLLLKYPVRLALNPFISTIGWLLPNLDLRLDHRRHRAQPADRGAAAAAVADGAGHVSRRRLHPADLRADAGRHADHRHPARAGRSAHPARVGDAHDATSPAAPPPSRQASPSPRNGG